MPPSFLQGMPDRSFFDSGNFLRFFRYPHLPKWMLGEMNGISQMIWL